jgi:hypothetical protein
MQPRASILGILSFSIGCAGCGATDGGAEASTATAAETSDAASTDDGPAPSDGTTSAASDDDDAGTTSGTAPPTDDTGTDTTGAPPTGDVWVDAEGEVIGLYRVVVDDDEDAVEGLVDFDDITWGVATDHMSVGAIDTFGQTFWESTDCTGPAFVAEVPSFGSFRGGVVASAQSADFTELLFVVPPQAEPAPMTFGSWMDWQYGCLNFDVGIYDFPPTSFYAEADLVFVEPPGFVPPLSIEHH